MNRALEKNEVEKGSRGNIGSRLYRKYVVFKTFIDYLIKIGKLSDLSQKPSTRRNISL